MSDTSEKSESAAAPHKAGAFDIRNIIGALMGLYGIILALAGVFGDKALEKTGGVNANLWTGLALIVVAAVFIGWARLRPIVVPTDVERPDDDPTRPAPQRKRPPSH
jgi:hypothetical protein